LDALRLIQAGQKDLGSCLARIEHLLADAKEPSEEEEEEEEEEEISATIRSDICPACEGLQTGRKDEGGQEKRYEVPITYLRERKEQGCSACALLYDGISLFYHRGVEKRWGDSSEIAVQWDSPQDGQTLQIHINAYDDFEHTSWMLITVLEFLIKSGTICSKYFPCLILRLVCIFDFVPGY